MLVKKSHRNNHFVIYRYHWIIISETLPRSSEDPMCRTVCREELCKLGHCHSFSSLGFHHSSYFFLQILSQLLRDFTGQYDITLLLHQWLYIIPWKQNSVVKPKLSFLSIQLWWERFKNPSGEAAPLSCWGCWGCFPQHEIQHCPLQWEILEQVGQRCGLEQQIQSLHSDKIYRSWLQKAHCNNTPLPKNENVLIRKAKQGLLL